MKYWKLSLMLLLSVFLFLSCHKGNGANCVETPAGDNLKFRFTDSSGNDLLAGPKAILDEHSLVAHQPCSTIGLENIFTSSLSGRDSIVTLRFKNFQTPVYGAPGNCFRVFFDWSATDQDTLDWHYKIDESGGCKQQIVDYMNYNGVQAKFISGNGANYYQCIKS